MLDIRTDEIYHDVAIMMTIVIINMIVTMMPIITFLFFHHILFLTALEVSLKS